MTYDRKLYNKISKDLEMLLPHHFEEKLTGEQWTDFFLAEHPDYETEIDRTDLVGLIRRTLYDYRGCWNISVIGGNVYVAYSREPKTHTYSFSVPLDFRQGNVSSYINQQLYLLKRELSRTYKVKDMRILHRGP